MLNKTTNSSDFLFEIFQPKSENAVDIFVVFVKIRANQPRKLYCGVIRMHC